MLNDISRLIDEHLQVVRASVMVVAVSGLFFTVKRFQLAKVYTKNNEVPTDFIKKSIKLRGIIKSVHENGDLGVQHQPIIFKKANKKEGELELKVAAVQLSGDYMKFLRENVLGKSISFIIIRKHKEILECEVYKQKQHFYARNISLNEELIKHGFGVVYREDTTNEISSTSYEHFVNRMVKVELLLEKQKLRENFFLRRWFENLKRLFPYRRKKG